MAFITHERVSYECHDCPFLFTLNIAGCSDKRAFFVKSFGLKTKKITYPELSSDTQSLRGGLHSSSGPLIVVVTINISSRLRSVLRNKKKTHGQFFGYSTKKKSFMRLSIIDATLMGLLRHRKVKSHSLVTVYFHMCFHLVFVYKQWRLMRRAFQKSNFITVNTPNWPCP